MKIAGTLFLKIDGEQCSLSGSCSYSLGGEIREGKSGASGVVGFTTTQSIPYIDVEVFIDDNDSLEKYKKIENATIVLELANGKTINYYNAWQSGELVRDAIAGTSSLKFEAISAKEV